MDSLTRVFFITNSKEDSEELFETLEAAQAHLLSVMDTENEPKISVAIVRNAFKENGEWNYEDRADTFENVINI